MEHDFITESSVDYELLDSGQGEKLERYGSVVLRRPDAQALWPKELSELDWNKADAVFTRTGTSGKWKTSRELKEVWNIKIEDISFSLQLLPSKHLGVFPEQAAEWKWLNEKIKKQKSLGKTVSVLNLFGYTGGASIACAKAGAKVVHVDASEFAVDLAHKNSELSEVSESIRFINDDVRKFIEREIKRGNKYDVVVLDPPIYGKGAKKQIWKIEDDLVPLMQRIRSVLSDKPVAVVLNGYASIYSNITYAQILASVTKNIKGSISSGGLYIKESSLGRLLPGGIFAIWEN